MLGENVTSLEETSSVAEEYVEALERASAGELDVEISLKPTHLGLELDPAATREHIAALARRSRERGTVWIDMEGSAYTDATLELFESLRGEHENVGVCLQAYLHRTPDDLDRLLPTDPRIRLVKGAYAEPPEIALAAKKDVDASYLDLGRRLLGHLAADRKGFLALGTHDPAMIRPLAGEAREAGLDGDRFEVEMLYGIGQREQERLVREGIPLRVLISYGEAWFPWYMRRLAERPANVWFVVRSLFR